MREFSQVFQDLLQRFFQFLLHSFSDLLHCFGCMLVLRGSPIFGVLNFFSLNNLGDSYYGEGLEVETSKV